MTTPESEELKVCRMYRDGIRVADIAVELRVAAATIYNCLKKYNVPKRQPHKILTTPPDSPRQPRAARPPSDSPFKAPIIDLDAEEARITAQLEEIRRKRVLMEEAKRLRVELAGTNGFRIMKEGESATLSLNDLEALIEQLMSLVPQPVTQ